MLSLHEATLAAAFETLGYEMESIKLMIKTCIFIATRSLLAEAIAQLRTMLLNIKSYIIIICSINIAVYFASNIVYFKLQVSHLDLHINSVKLSELVAN